MPLFYLPNVTGHQDELPEEEALHAIKVLRLQSGDMLTITDGKGCFYQAQITSITRRSCTVNVVKTIIQPPLWTGHLHIAVAPTKNMERIEWFVEKATEIGLDELTLLNCQHSERHIVKAERINKILLSAMKQSLKARLPKLNSMEDFGLFIKNEIPGKKFIAHCHEGEKVSLKDAVRQGENTTVLIGPEGDFSEEEVQAAIRQGYIPTSLGPSRLRTETAALVACHIINLKNQI